MKNYKKEDTLVLSHSCTRYEVPEYSCPITFQDAQNLDFVTASTLQVSEVDWVIDNWIARGELTVIAGPAGVGKSTLACLWMAGVTNPHASTLPPQLKPKCNGHVLVFDTENDHASTVLPRLIAAGADLEKVHFVGANKDVLGIEKFSFSNPKHLERLEQRIREIAEDFCLIMLDPLYQAAGGDHDKNSIARSAYERLPSLAKNLNCAIV